MDLIQIKIFNLIDFILKIGIEVQMKISRSVNI